MKAQAFADPSRAQYLMSKKTVEINPRHPIVVELLNQVKADAEVRLLLSAPCLSHDVLLAFLCSHLQSQSAANSAWLLYDVALLNSGFQIEDNGGFSSRIYSIMKEYVCFVAFS